MSENLDEDLKDGLTVDQRTAAAKHEGVSAEQAQADREAQYIDALLVEREGYARFGRDDRVADVDAELERRGYKAAAESRAKAAPKAVKGRATTPTDQT